MSPTTPTARAVAAVLTWCSYYTRSIDPAAAKSRRDEIRSDLHEQVTWARATGQPDGHISRSVRSRALRGALNDLSWRRAQRRREALADPLLTRARRADKSVSSALTIYGLLLVAWGVYVCLRVAQNVAAGEIKPWSLTSITLLVATALAGCGLVLVARPRTRPIGALWLAVPTVILVHSGLYQLYFLSATLSWFSWALTGWSLAVNLLVVGALILLAAATIWSWPARTPTFDRTRASEDANGTLGEAS
jgi:hypothetical protein